MQLEQRAPRSSYMACRTRLSTRRPRTRVVRRQAQGFGLHEIRASPNGHSANAVFVKRSSDTGSGDRSIPATPEHTSDQRRTNADQCPSLVGWNRLGGAGFPGGSHRATESEITEGDLLAFVFFNRLNQCLSHRSFDSPVLQDILGVPAVEKSCSAYHDMPPRNPQVMS